MSAIPSLYSSTSVGAPSSFFGFDSASTLNYASGTGRRLCSKGSPSWTAAGHTGGALSLDGGSYLFGNYKAYPVGDAPYSMSLWFKATVGMPGSNVPLICMGAPGYLKTALCANVQDRIRVQDVWWGGDLLRAVTGVFSDEVWHHFASTFDGTTRKLYIDGRLIGSDTPSGHAVSSRFLTIGCFASVWNDGAGNLEGFTKWLGQIDDVALYTAALTTADVLQLYGGTPATPSTAPAPYSSVASPPVIYFPFDSAATVTREAIDGRNLGTLSNDGTSVGSGVTWTAAGHTGGGVTMDGSSYIYGWSLGLANAQGNSPYTVSAWVKFAATRTAPALNPSFIAYGGSNWFESNALVAGGLFSLGNGWYNNDLTRTAGYLYDGLWHHVCATYDGSTSRKLYFDGLLAGSDTPTPNHNVNAYWTYIGKFMSGTMDELAVFNVALSAADVATLAGLAPVLAPVRASLPWPLSVPTPLPVALWTFDSVATLGKDSVSGFTLVAQGDVQLAANGGRHGGGLFVNSGALPSYAYLTGAVPSLPTGGSSYTVATWVKPLNAGSSPVLVSWGPVEVFYSTNLLQISSPATVRSVWWGECNRA